MLVEIAKIVLREIVAGGCGLFVIECSFSIVLLDTLSELVERAELGDGFDIAGIGGDGNRLRACT